MEQEVVNSLGIEWAKLGPTILIAVVLVGMVINAFLGEILNNRKEK